MRSEEIDTLMNYLKEEIQLKFGGEIAYAKDCQILSLQILETTKRQLSESTLKRFFGIIDSPFSPSKFTLDTLAVYLNFSNWQDFVNSFENEKHFYSNFDSWKQLKNRVNVITELSYKSMKGKEDGLFEGAPLREFADFHFQSFLDSPQIASAFVAPGGYGKSTLIAQLTEKYFTGEDAIYPDDIVCLIDGSILYNLITQNIKINRLYQLLKFDPQDSFSNYFRENPEKVKGRFVMIIDGFNEMVFSPQELNHFIGNLIKIVASYENLDWFKLFISCRPDVWRAFSSSVKKNTFLQSKWYRINFDVPEPNEINVPKLTKREVRKSSHEFLDGLSLGKRQMLFENYDLFRFPLFVHLLQSGRINLNSSLFELLKQYVCEVYLSGPYQIERTNLLNSIVQLSEKGRLGTFVSKDKLFPSGISSVAYNVMVSYGILKEFTKSLNFLDLTTYVEFSQDIIFSFLVANKWIEERELNRELIESIYNYYPKSSEFREQVLRFIIQYSFLVGKTDFLKELFMLSELKGNTFFPGLEVLIEEELKNSEDNLEELIPVWVESNL
jgi:hypothetical protein